MAFYFGRKREYGAEQPWVLGKLKSRFPFAHFPFELPDYAQGLILSVAGMGIITSMEDTLAIPFGIALTLVIINTLMYQLHPSLGDPTVPGWITPALPLVIAFLSAYEMGAMRFQALIALQICVGLLFLVMGSTGAAGKLIEKIPGTIKAGILLGAGMAALIGEFKAGGRILSYPIGIGIAGVFSFFVMYGKMANYWRNRNAFFRFIIKYGIAVPTLLGYVVSLIAGETIFPQIEWSFTRLDIGGILSLSPFNIGFPSFDMIIAAIPLAFAAYIIAFGDIIWVNSLYKAVNEKRPDEKVNFEPNRSNLICAFRNLFQSMVYPFIGLAGPLWTGGTALIANRFMNSKREEMETFWGGAWLYYGLVSAMFLGPFVSFLRPALPIAMSLMMLIQGYLSGYLGMEMVETSLQRGIAVIMACVLATQGAAIGLGVGILLYLFLEHDWSKKEKEQTSSAA